MASNALVSDASREGCKVTLHYCVYHSVEMRGEFQHGERVASWANRLYDAQHRLRNNLRVSLKAMTKRAEPRGELGKRHVRDPTG